MDNKVNTCEERFAKRAQKPTDAKPRAISSSGAASAEVNLFGLCRIATEEDEVKEEYESQTCLSDTERLERKQQYLRRQFVKEQWKCMNHCPSCGKCRILKGKDPEELYADFIDGKRTYMDITLEIRKR